MIEYALLTALVAIAVYAWLPAGYNASLSHIWGRVQNVLAIYGGA